MLVMSYLIKRLLISPNIAYDIIILGTRTHDQFLQLLRILLRTHNSIVNSGQVETEKLKFGNGRLEFDACLLYQDSVHTGVQ